MTIVEVISVTLGVVGLACTVWTIYKMYYPNDPCCIQFIPEFYVSLFTSAVHNLPIEIFYKGEKIKTNLVLLSGYFVNTGIKDITQTMIAKRLSIVLPVGVKWLEGKIVSASYEGNKKDPDILNTEEWSKLVFNLELFRHDTYIHFEALAEVASQSSFSYDEASLALARTMSFEHEIADTRKVVSDDPSRRPLFLYPQEASKEMIFFLSAGAFVLWVWAIDRVYNYTIVKDINNLLLALFLTMVSSAFTMLIIFIIMKLKQSSRIRKMLPQTSKYQKTLN